MTSLEDRMRTNRQVLAELTESERAADAALRQVADSGRELKRQSDALAGVIEIHRQAYGRVWTACLLAGVTGGLIGGLVVAIVGLWTL